MICHEIPYPPDNGGRVDAWRRIKAFAQFGVELQLIAWHKHQPKVEDLVEIHKHVKSIYLIAFNNSLLGLTRRVIDLFTYPLEVTSRIIRGEAVNRLFTEVRAFNPDLIWLDYLHGAEVASLLAKNLNLPLISRSHNIEHLYYDRLRNSTTDLKNRLRRTLSVAHLEKYEKTSLKNSTLFYDISIDDLNFWQKQGYTNGRYLPPFIDFANDENLLDNQDDDREKSKYDLVFLGNLYIDNNVAGVTWLIEEVLPIVRATIPDIKLLIAGSKAVQKIKDLCSSEAGVELKINPTSSMSIYNSGKVLVNPVATGSGVSMKSLEMLLAGKPIVSQPQGMAGLPDILKPYFHIAEDPQSFAKEIIDLLTGTKHTQAANRLLLESLFGFQAIKHVLSDLDELIKTNK
jgi:glycosyltransferase involved in cell wall biosynthesis